MGVSSAEKDHFSARMLRLRLKKEYAHLRYSSRKATSGHGPARVVKVVAWPRHTHCTVATAPLDPCARGTSAQRGNTRRTYDVGGGDVGAGVGAFVCLAGGPHRLMLTVFDPGLQPGQEVDGPQREQNLPFTGSSGTSALFQPQGNVTRTPSPSGGALRMAAPYKRHGGNGATRSLRA